MRDIEERIRKASTELQEAVNELIQEASYNPTRELEVHVSSDWFPVYTVNQEKPSFELSTEVRISETVISRF